MAVGTRQPILETSSTYCCVTLAKLLTLSIVLCIQQAKTCQLSTVWALGYDSSQSERAGGVEGPISTKDVQRKVSGAGGEGSEKTQTKLPSSRGLQIAWFSNICAHWADRVKVHLGTWCSRLFLPFSFHFISALQRQAQGSAAGGPRACVKVHC